MAAECSRSATACARRASGRDSSTPRSSSTPAVVTQHNTVAPSGLRFVGLGKGTYLEVRRRSSVGPVLFQGTLRPGDAQFIAGTRFWLFVRQPVGVRFKLAGRPVSLPA